jgi:hypothetical protein
MSNKIRTITTITVSSAWYDEQKEHSTIQMYAETATIANTQTAAEQMKKTWLEQDGGGIKTKYQIVKDQGLTVSFMTKDEHRKPPRFPLGFTVRRRDTGRECEIECFIWFPPIEAYLYKIRPTGSEHNPSDWLSAERLVGPAEWRELHIWAKTHRFEFRENTGRFHRGKTYSISVLDMAHQRNLEAIGVSPVWPQREENKEG